MVTKIQVPFSFSDHVTSFKANDVYTTRKRAQEEFLMYYFFSHQANCIGLFHM